MINGTGLHSTEQQAGTAYLRKQIITDNHIRIEKKDETRELLINRISSFCFEGYEER